MMISHYSISPDVNAIADQVIVHCWRLLCIYHSITTDLYCTKHFTTLPVTNLGPVTILWPVTNQWPVTYLSQVTNLSLVIDWFTACTLVYRQPTFVLCYLCLWKTQRILVSFAYEYLTITTPTLTDACDDIILTRISFVSSATETILEIRCSYYISINARFNYVLISRRNRDLMSWWTVVILISNKVLD